MLSFIARCFIVMLFALFYRQFSKFLDMALDDYLLSLHQRWIIADSQENSSDNPEKP